MWILLKQETVSGSGISWAICKSASRSRQITMPALHHSVFYRPDALPATQPTASKHWTQNTHFENYSISRCNNDRPCRQSMGTKKPLCTTADPICSLCSEIKFYRYTVLMLDSWHKGSNTPFLRFWVTYREQWDQWVIFPHQVTERSCDSVKPCANNATYSEAVFWSMRKTKLTGNWKSMFIWVTAIKWTTAITDSNNKQTSSEAPSWFKTVTYKPYG